MGGVYKKLGEGRYPLPDVSTAIDQLYGGVEFEWDYLVENGESKFVVWEHPEGKEPPTREEIDKEMDRQCKIYNYYQYEREREKEYLPIKDQLDMLYHDIKSGNLENGSWIKSVESVKERIPKPETKIEFHDLSN